jgi:hypothetical protein
MTRLRWLFGLRRRSEQLSSPSANEGLPGPEEAQQDLVDARERFRQTLREQPRVERAVAKSEKRLARNHLGEDIEQALLRRTSP